MSPMSAIAIGRKRIPAWMAAHEIPQSERANIYLVNVETILPNEISRNNLLAAIRSIVEPGEDFFLIIDVLRGTMTALTVTTKRPPRGQAPLKFSLRKGPRFSP